MEKESLKKVLIKAVETGADFADIYIEDTVVNNVILVDNAIDRISTSVLHGAGLRVCIGENTYYAYSNLIDEDKLLALASNLASLIYSQKKVNNIVVKESEFESKHPIIKHPNNVSIEDKKEMLYQINEAARGYSDLVTQVELSLKDEVQKVTIVNSEGKYALDERVRIRLFVKVYAKQGDVMEEAYYSKVAAHQGYELLDGLDFKQIGIDTAKKAITKLSAKECPSGEMPVIIGNGFGGVIFHEACVHSLEASNLVNGLSVFNDKLNQKIASDAVTLVDDGTVKNMWGSTTIDDDGNDTARNVLIENGILKSYLIDERNGKRINMSSTGSSRRENYKFIPTARMNNTHVLNGSSTLEEMIKSIDYGLYAKDMGGGSVNPTTGDFNFAVSEAYIIKNGEIKELVKGASLIGNGADVLMKVEMVGNDFDYGVGVCGASSGNVPVTVGQPSLKVSSMTVGGRKKAE